MGYASCSKQKSASQRMLIFELAEREGTLTAQKYVQAHISCARGTHGSALPPPRGRSAAPDPLRVRIPPSPYSLRSLRRGRDSNPRYGCPHSGFQDRCNRPLCHLSLNHNIALQYYDRAITHHLCKLAKMMRDVALKHFVSQKLYNKLYNFFFPNFLSSVHHTFFE
jgi:hypothetical protein